MQTTIGQLLVNEVLPPALRNYTRELNKKEIRDLMTTVAEVYPDQYPRIAQQLSDIGRRAAYETGGFSFGPKSLRQTRVAQAAVADLKESLSQIYSQPGLDDKSREALILETVGKVQQSLPKAVLEEALSEHNPLALQAVSGMRGNANTVNSILGADLLYTDHTGKRVPVPVLHSYSQGLTPAEYFAAAYGVRKGIIDLKQATADAGFLAKQLNQAAHRLVVSATDSDIPDETPRGLPVDTTDMDSVGALLASPIGGYARHTIITPKLLKDLQSQGIDEVLVRSPTVGGPEDGGVYARSVGVRERGGLSPIGDFVGNAALQSLSEPLTQSQISSKHSGGIAGASAGAIAGFKAINAMVQIPDNFPDGAAHADRDGEISAIRDAPQGGTYVNIGGQEHYIAAGFSPTVKVGDRVEAGDVISGGAPSPALIVKHKGIGEGRRYFTQLFRDVLRNSGVSAGRRNVEMAARALINHVRLTDEVGDWNPDDIVPYQSIEATWTPRQGNKTVPPKKAIGMYLEKPVLHYGIGDMIKPSMLARFEKHGISNVVVHDTPPPWQPEMVRGMINMAHDPDWMTRMLGSYQQKSVLEGARLGLVSDEEGTSYVPALARRVEFGDIGKTKGWQPDADSR